MRRAIAALAIAGALTLAALVSAQSTLPPWLAPIGFGVIGVGCVLIILKSCLRRRPRAVEA